MKSSKHILVPKKKLRKDAVIQTYYVNPNKRDISTHSERKSLSDLIDEAYNTKKKILKPKIKNKNKSKEDKIRPKKSIEDLLYNNVREHPEKISDEELKKLPIEMQELYKNYRPVNTIAYSIQPSKGEGFALFGGKNLKETSKGLKLFEKLKYRGDNENLVNSLVNYIEKVINKLSKVDDFFSKIDRIVTPPPTISEEKGSNYENKLIKKIAEKLAKRHSTKNHKIEYDDLYLGIKDKNLRAVTTSKEKSFQNFLEHGDNLIDDKKERILFLDDIITTGVTGRVIKNVLKKHNKKVYPFYLYKNL